MIESIKKYNSHSKSNVNEDNDVNDEELNLYIKELSMGIKEELEHTSDLFESTKIAMDHLKEDKKYYSKLKSIGL